MYLGDVLRLAEGPSKKLFERYPLVMESFEHMSELFDDLRKASQAFQYVYA